MASHISLLRQNIISQSTRRLRLLSTTPIILQRPLSIPKAQPSPPRLPKQEQEIFERLQKSPTLRYTYNDPTTDDSNRVTHANQASVEEGTRTPEKLNASEEGVKGSIQVQETQLHPDARRVAKPEFEGDVNPRTGEVGGPKNEPLRWGADGEWTYNGRATDF